MGSALAAVASSSRSATHAGPPEPTGPDQLTRVVQVRSDALFTDAGMHEGLLADLFRLFLIRVTDKTDARDAWRTILDPNDVVALKFNRCGANALGTVPAMARVLVQSLEDAGFRRSQIVAVEAPPDAIRQLGLTAPRPGWTEQVHDFGSGTDRLAAWLDQVTAIVNVPFLKTHNIAGMTCALKNLSHAVVKHPAQFHDNGCSPYIADIVALPAIRDKLRLHVANALRLVFQDGPEANPGCIWDAGVLLGGFDPVAVDVIGLQTLDRVRAAISLPSICERKGPPAYLEAAATRGLGDSRLHEILVDKAKL